MNSFLRCSNGHYYSANLENCPYCGSLSPMAKTFSQEESYQIDPECAEWFPNYFTVSSEQEIFDRLHQYRDAAIRDMNKSWLTTLDDIFWYKLMYKYIDEYTMKIIERKQCYKYGLPELDSNKEVIKPHHIFWKLKKAIIYIDYGLIWLTPEEVFIKLRDYDYYMWDD